MPNLIRIVYASHTKEIAIQGETDEDPVDNSIRRGGDIGNRCARHAQGIEWEILNKEVVALYQQGQYDRAVIVAKKAIEVAEKAIGRDHPDVATSLEKMAALYRETDRKGESRSA